MPKRAGPVHVATTTVRRGRRVYRTHLLRRSFREEGKVKHETVGNLSHLPPHLIEIVREGLRGRTYVPVDEALECVRTRSHGHVLAVVGTMRRLGLDGLLASRPGPERSRALGAIAARLLDPRSEWALDRMLSSRWAVTTLPEVLGVGDSTPQQVRSALEWLNERRRRIENRIAKRHTRQGRLHLLVADLTPTRDAVPGVAQAPRDPRRGVRGPKLRIAVGLLSTKDGCPVALDVIEGRGGEPIPAAGYVASLRRRFALERVVVAGEQGMLTAERLRRDLGGGPSAGSERVRLQRLRSQAFVYLLACHVEWHMRRAWRPILVAEPGAGATGGPPLHTFPTLLADLATIVRNRMRPVGLAEAEFDLVTAPTPHQRRALGLLGVRLDG